MGNDSADGSSGYLRYSFHSDLHHQHHGRSAGCWQRIHGCSTNAVATTNTSTTNSTALSLCYHAEIVQWNPFAITNKVVYVGDMCKNL